MKYYVPAITTCIFLPIPFSSIYAQYISPNDAKGNVKTVEQRRYDEYKSKQNNATPKPVPGIIPAKTNSSTQNQQTNVNPKNYTGALTYINGYGYEKIEPFSEGLAVATINFKYGFINESGKPVIPLVYDYALKFEGGLACVSKDKKYGFIDKTGMEVIPPIYDETGFYFYEECIKMRLKGKWGLLDKKGNTLLPFIYQEIRYCKEGMVAARPAYLWGYLDKTGKVAVDFKYDETYAFSKGIAPVKSGNKWGYIDNTGAEIILPLTYTESDIMKGKVAAELINGRVRFQYAGVTRWFDKTGKEIKE